MRFLIKAAFWFGVVLLVLPFFRGEPAAPPADADRLELDRTVMAAREAFADIQGFCDRRPSVCETGGTVLAALRERAREGARIAYRVFDTQSGADDGAMTTGGIEDRTTGSQGSDPAAGADRQRPWPQ